MAEYDKTPFMELGNEIDHPIGCANCHEANTMKLIVTNPALEEALEAQRKAYQKDLKNEMPDFAPTPEDKKVYKF